MGENKARGFEIRVEMFIKINKYFSINLSHAFPQVFIWMNVCR